MRRLTLLVGLGCAVLCGSVGGPLHAAMLSEPAPSLDLGCAYTCDGTGGSGTPVDCTGVDVGCGREEVDDEVRAGIIFRRVGNPGNEGEDCGYSPGDDDIWGPAGTCGAVDYEYYIGKCEVTNQQYIEFLNAVGKTDAYTMWSLGLADHLNGIDRHGSIGDFYYTSLNNDPCFCKVPVGRIGPARALRFVNWLHNGQPAGQQDAFTTEDGAYRLVGNTSVFKPRTCDCSDDCTEPGNEIPRETCFDGIDNDCDGDADCADSDRACANEECASGDPYCWLFRCGNGVCDYQSSENPVNCPADCTETNEGSNCDDQIDNDNDGYIDCDDDDCDESQDCPDCTPTDSVERPYWSCHDGIDNDCDEDTDCDDSDCDGAPACSTECDSGPCETPGIRRAGAQFWLPNEDEWYKAAYYTTDLNGQGPGYYDFATQSQRNGEWPPTGSYSTWTQWGWPAWECPPGDEYAATGSGNYLWVVTPYYAPTMVGSYEEKPSESFYGTYDQFGNRTECVELRLEPRADFACRGGAYEVLDTEDYTAQGRRQCRAFISSSCHSEGFRVAASVEPVGACCSSQGACSEMSEDDCALGSGTYLGDGRRCYDGTCNPQRPLPEYYAMGACAGTGVDCRRDDQCPGPERCFGVAQTCFTDEDCTPAVEDDEAQCITMPEPYADGPGMCYAPKLRYISIARHPWQHGGTARRISLVGGGAGPWWVGVPENHGYTTAQGNDKAFWVSKIAGQPHFPGERGWPMELDGRWPDILHVTGCEIVPNQTYTVEAAVPDGGGYTFSPPLTLPTTTTWGDVVSTCTNGACSPAQGEVDIDDVLAVTAAFQNNDNAPRAWMDLVPAAGDSLPDQVVDIDDVNAVIAGFQSQPYPGNGPLNCGD